MVHQVNNNENNQNENNAASRNKNLYFWPHEGESLVEKVIKITPIKLDSHFYIERNVKETPTHTEKSKYWVLKFDMPTIWLVLFVVDMSFQIPMKYIEMAYAK